MIKRIYRGLKRRALIKKEDAYTFTNRIKYDIIQYFTNYSHLETKGLCNKKWYGNDYGGFYINPDLLNENSIVYSFGIGEDISFDLDVMANHRANVYGFDPMPRSVAWVKLQDTPEKFTFFDYGISHKTGVVDFFLPRNTRHISGSSIPQNFVNINRRVSVMMKTLQETIETLGHKKIDVIKIDIEGSEYDIIDDILETTVPINQILLEFHDRFFKKGVKKTRQAIKKLEEKGYLIFAVSDSKFEVSFIHKSLLK